MTISFRTRLFVVSVLIVTAVLAAVMTLGWSSVLKVEIDRLDDRLCMEARRIATQPFRGDDLARLEADVALKLRLGSAGQLMLRFDPAGGGPGFESAGWRTAPLPASADWVATRRPDERGMPADDGQRPLPDRPPRPGAPDRPSPGACSLVSFAGAGSEWRVARFELPLGRSVVAADLAGMNAELKGVTQRALTLVIPMALLLTALGAWLLASITMQPVNRLRGAMKGVTQKALDQRLPSAGEDREFKELIGEYNTMLERLESSFHQASRFSADAAHELKTPLTILQGQIEQAVSRPDRRAMQADLTQMLDEVGRLTAITRKLLLLSQADAGRLALHRVRVDLTELLDELMADAQMLITGQTVYARVERSLALQADAVLLRQLFNNLINNAVRYCTPNGWIEVRGRVLAGGIEVVFANQTVVIAAADRARFFERFFRGDAAHNSRIEGNGLGLSLAREVARAHGGELTLEPGPPDEVTLRLWLPSD
jgi:two-component system, OmpR family, heavy metal sensor histidine kinase CusS